MPLHPIIALDHILQEYEDHLLTEFRARDENLRRALEREIEKPLFLAQEPFYQAHRPFRPGLKWREVGLDVKLAGVMESRAHADRAYSHQSDAIAELLRPDARPVVVTTPLHLCRNCGADYLQLTGDPQEGSLKPASGNASDTRTEWMLLDSAKFETTKDGEDAEDANEDEPQTGTNTGGKGVRRDAEVVAGDNYTSTSTTTTLRHGWMPERMLM